MKSAGKTENLQQLTDFNFTSEELNELDAISKGKKFSVRNQIDIVYSDGNLQKLKYFINSLRLFEHLAYYFTNAQHTEKENIYRQIAKKIKDILDDYGQLYIDAEILHTKYSGDVQYAKHRVKRKIDSFIVENSKKINMLMSFVYQVGQHIVQVNPSEVMGYS